MKRLALGLACAAIASSFSAIAAPSLDSLARDVERAQAIRDVKNLQYTYAQYAQYGLWEDMSELFAKAGVLDTGTEQLKGPKAIATFLAARYGNGHPGLEPGAVDTQIIATPVVNLSVDGGTAKARWNTMMLLADAKGHARIEGGIFENDYVREESSPFTSMATPRECRFPLPWVRRRTRKRRSHLWKSASGS
jgi:hypothetical protein